MQINIPVFADIVPLAKFAVVFAVHPEYISRVSRIVSKAIRIELFDNEDNLICPSFPAEYHDSPSSYKFSDEVAYIVVYSGEIKDNAAFTDFYRKGSFEHYEFIHDDYRCTFRYEGKLESEVVVKQAIQVNGVETWVRVQKAQ